ncbi:hypothetical protein [Aureliella helgolandensis]|uniref:Uncharacterized protein n=1 Tax=Aureliella helgolandensis TaxID=2527968 RepID=A0A518G549_9BACT|nr:hypothetical protein [Aureliella helgolandensis]QDV23712.1 hypothetical protein Q31a_20170 [Aureliella helgolandensis]
MDHTHIVEGTHEIVASGVEITSKVDLGDSTINLYAQGCGVGTGTGNIELNANGKVAAYAGEATFQLACSVDGISSAILDGGPLGSVVLANSLPVGTAQTIELSAMSQSIEISNGNVPGATQLIKLDAESQSIEISAGGLPVSPTIKMSPMGIKLSAGPTSFIEITPEGVTISGLMVSVKGEAQTEISGAMVNLEAEGIAAIKGALVQIQ